MSETADHIKPWLSMADVCELTDACNDKANDVSDLIDAMEDVADRFVESRTAGVSAKVAHDVPQALIPTPTDD